MSSIQSKENFQASSIGSYAGFVSRLFAFTIDILIISAMIMFTTWFLATILEMLQINLFFKTIVHRDLGVLFSSNSTFEPVLASVVTFLLTIIYHIFFWYTVGQTPGKAILGIRIVPLAGGKITLWRAFLRYFGYILSGIAFGFGFLWILFDDRRMAWHDKIANTCVIHTWDAHPDESFLKLAREKFTTDGKSNQEHT